MKNTENLRKRSLVTYKLDNPINRLLYPEYSVSKVFDSMVYIRTKYPETCDHVLLDSKNLKLLYSKSKDSGTLAETFCGIPFRKLEVSPGAGARFSGISGHFLGYSPNAGKDEVISVFLSEVDQFIDTTVDELISFFIEINVDFK